MHVNPQTLWLGLTIASVVSTGAFLGLVRYAPGVPGPPVWAASPLCLSIAFGSCMIVLPDWRINSLIYNIPYALSPILLMAGSLRFDGRKMPSGFVLTLVGASVAAAVAFTYVWPDTPLRIATLTVVVAVGYLGAAIATGRASAGAARLPAAILAVSFTLLAVMTIARAALNLWHPILTTFDVNSIGGLDPVIYLVVASTTILSAPFLVLLVAARLHENLEAEQLKTKASFGRIRALVQRVEAIREEERRSIAHTLHEGVAQDLAAASFALTTGRHGANDPADDAVAKAIAQSIQKLRAVTNSLRPDTLTLLSLPEAVTAYARSFAEDFDLPITVLPPDKSVDLDEQTRVIFFRASQEALMNVARHAHATHVEIAFGVRNGRPVMTVSDDGVGMSTADLQKDHALGLLGIRERFEAIGGELQVEVGQGRGTVVTLVGPVLDAGPSIHRAASA